MSKTMNEFSLLVFSCRFKLRSTWWGMCQWRVVHTKIYVYVFQLTIMIYIVVTWWNMTPWPSGYSDKVELWIRDLMVKAIYSAPSVYRPPFYRHTRLSPKFSSVPISPITIPRYTAKLSYRHPRQLFRHKSRKTNSNSPVSTAHNYLLTAVYWSVIMECQNWSSDAVIDLIVEGQNRWSVVLIRIIACIYFSSKYICTFNPD
jgi:hypothetical protein